MTQPGTVICIPYEVGNHQLRFGRIQISTNKHLGQQGVNSTNDYFHGKEVT